MNNLKIFDFLQKKQVHNYLHMQSRKNKRKKQRKQYKIVIQNNRIDNIYYFGIDKVSSPKYNINYFKYYLEKYIIDLILKYK